MGSAPPAGWTGAPFGNRYADLYPTARAAAWVDGSMPARRNDGQSEKSTRAMPSGGASSVASSNRSTNPADGLAATLREILSYHIPLMSSTLPEWLQVRE